MTKSNIDYERVFNSLCHFVGISRTVKLEDVIDNLIVTAIVFDGGEAPIAVGQIAEAIQVYFSIDLSRNDLQTALARLAESKKLSLTQDDRYYVQEETAREVSRRSSEAKKLEERVKEEWWLELAADEILGLWISEADQSKLWHALQAYMAKSFRRHGAQTIKLLDPEASVNEDSQLSLSILLKQALEEHDFSAPEDQPKARTAIQVFFKNQTVDRVVYLSQLLDGTFSFFALNYDTAVTEYLSSEIKPLSIFLDTNFIFGILGLHYNPLVEVSEELISIIEVHFPSFKLYYHTATLAEMQRTIGAIGDNLKERQWSQALSRAAVRNGQVSALEIKYHQANATQSVKPDIFLSKFLQSEALLDEKGFTIFRDSKQVDLDTKSQLVAEYKDYIESRRHPKPYRAYDHDMQVLITARSRRGSRKRSVLDSGSMFLTCDYYLYQFDQHQAEYSHELGTVILPNHLLQLLRPLMPASADFDRRFVETFAIPEFRTIGSDYSVTITDILMYLATYSDINEETATRILADELLINHLNNIDNDSEEFGQQIEDALVRDNELLLEEVIALNEEKLELQQSSKEKEEEREEAFRQVKAQLTEQERKAHDNETAMDVITQDLGELKQDLSTQRSASEQQARESQEKINLLETQIAETRKGNLQWRILFALFFCGFLTWFVIGYLANTAWLSQHANSLGLKVSMIVIIWATGAAIVVEKYRKWIVGVIVVAVAVGMIQLL